MSRLKHNTCSRLLLILAALFITACSQTPALKVTAQSEQNWALRQQQLASIDAWEIHARAAILVRARPDTKLSLSGGASETLSEDKVYPVGINWSRQQTQFSMTIEAPFGQGVIRIESNRSGNDNKQFKLTLADGAIRLGATPEALLVDLLGWSIPVSGLNFWIKGLPQPDIESSYDIDGAGRLKSLRQNDWLVNYLAYFSEQEQAQQLPKRLYLKHDNLGIKLVIERWEKRVTPVETESLFPSFD